MNNDKIITKILENISDPAEGNVFFTIRNGCLFTFIFNMLFIISSCPSVKINFCSVVKL